MTTDCGRARLGLLLPGNGLGGIWRYAHALLAGIDLHEFEVTLFCDLQGAYEPRPAVRVVPLSSGRRAEPHSAARPTALGQPEAPHHPAASRLWRATPHAVRLWAGFVRDAVRLARLLRHHALDLLHTQSTGCDESPLAGRFAGISRVLGTFHTDSALDLHGVRSGFRHRLLECLSNRCLHQAIAVSRAAGDDWVRRTGMPAERVVPIYNGIDTDLFRRRSPPQAARLRLGLPASGNLLLGGVGRLSEEKGFQYLIEAAAQLLPEHPSLMVVLAGGGPQLRPLQDLAVRLGVADRVRFLGQCGDIQLVYDALDALVLPSLSEALGYVLLEAMASGLPVVGTRVGGIPEVITHGETGWLVPPRHPDALARALQPLLTSEDLRKRFGRSGRQRVVKHFSEKEMVRRTIKMYRELLRGPQAAITSKKEGP